MSKFCSHIEKSAISTMPTVAFEGRIITIDTVDAAEKAVKALWNEKIVGIDTETRHLSAKGYTTPYPCYRLQLQTHVSLYA